MSPVESSYSDKIVRSGDLRLGVSEIAHHSGLLRRFQRAAAVDGLSAGGVRVPADDSVDLDLRLEGVAEGVVVSGDIAGAWVAECSRCLEPIEGPFAVEVHELFNEEPVEGETYLLDGDEIDLVPLIRDAVVLELPPAPLCVDDCRGLCPRCGVDRNQKTCDCVIDEGDPRWSALVELRFDDS